MYPIVSHTVSQAQGRISVGPCVQTGLSQASGVAAYAKSLAEPCALVICLPPMKTFRGSRAASLVVCSRPICTHGFQLSKGDCWKNDPYYITRIAEKVGEHFREKTMVSRKSGTVDRL